MNDLYIDLRLSWVRNFDIRFSALICRDAFLHISDICKSNFNESSRVIPSTLMRSLGITTLSCTVREIETSPTLFLALELIGRFGDMSRNYYPIRVFTTLLNIWTVDTCGRTLRLPLTYCRLWPNMTYMWFYDQCTLLSPIATGFVYAVS